MGPEPLSNSVITILRAYGQQQETFGRRAPAGIRPSGCRGPSGWGRGRAGGWRLWRGSGRRWSSGSRRRARFAGTRRRGRRPGATPPAASGARVVGIGRLRSGHWVGVPSPLDRSRFLGAGSGSLRRCSGCVELPLFTIPQWTAKSPASPGSFALCDAWVNLAVKRPAVGKTVEGGDK